MNLDALRYFAVTARHEHITRAADELSLSQPALSRAIAQLENELGAPLFDRVGRRVRLNAAGAALLPYVEQALSALAAGVHAVSAYSDAARGVVRLGFLHTAGTYLVPTLLRDFRRVRPDVRFQLHQASTTGLLAALDAGGLDLAIATRPAAMRGLACTHLLTEELFAAVPPGHRFARRKQIRLSELAEEDFITLEPQNSYRQLVDDFCARAGFAPCVVFEGEEVQTVRGLVEAGLGVAILPALAWEGQREATPVRVRISEPRCMRTIDLLWPAARPLSPAAEGFRVFVAELAGTRGAAPVVSP